MKGNGDDRRVKITQVNTQGSKSDALTSMRQSIGASSGPTFGLIQEGGMPPLAWGLQPHPSNPQLLTGQIGGSDSRTRSKPLFVALQLPRGRKAKQPSRNTQIIMSNRPFSEVQELQAGRLGAGLRPALVVETADAFVGSVHEPSGAPAFAAAQARDQWTDLSAKAKNKRKPAALVGDFNMDNRRLVDTMRPLGGHVVSPAGATQQSGGTLDHAVFSTPGATVRQDTAMSGDHTQQTFEAGPAAKRAKLRR